MVGCCVVGCGRNSSKPLNDTRYDVSLKRRITYHQFPADLGTRKKWIKAVCDGGRVDDWTPGGNTKICSVHFDLKDIRYNDKGTQIIKGAIPNIPRSDKKKPPRRSKIARETALKKIILEAVDQEVEEEIVCGDFLGTTVFFDPDAPGSSSENIFLPFEEAMEIEEFQEDGQENAKSKKVVKLADEHTFDAQGSSCSGDPTLALFAELTEKMKKLNMFVAKNHPSKATKMQKVFNEFSTLFNKDTKDAPLPNMLSGDNPYLSAAETSTDEALASEFWEDEFNDPGFEKILENPEDFLTSFPM
ncbi:uncharacterized protein LOC132198027 [Neocloeon triangulifer]|uniref:uncharacterized protein LOC132198027 n=1 Tax=Neocloeon triangulifer TaxID=2078957 RepID=UPI00286F29DA|nr:uncharacterized protein LOC132198027 [Neocloeon triangulifer]